MWHGKNLFVIKPPVGLCIFPNLLDILLHYLLQILHAAFGFVRSSAVLTTMQVFSRTALLWFVVEPIFQVFSLSLPVLNISCELLSKLKSTDL